MTDQMYELKAEREIDGWDMDEYLQSSSGLFQRRMALINSVAVVIRDTGRWAAQPQ